MGVVSLSDVRPGAVVELRLPETASIEGDLVSATGLACGDCALSVYSDESATRRTVWSSADGHYVVEGIQPGTVRLSAKHSDFSADMTLQLVPGQRQRGLRLVLSERSARADVAPE